ncbi:leucyl/phenylalanyl-tRNA--protein transferase [Amaricoccus tamworthensis]|uniref:leucyl/phenylalanyl-tRNA--protein transferase n=1 Tax=Amaricoccus tamworthensis TaxID=57002 RepID=UPI003C79958B
MRPLDLLRAYAMGIFPMADDRNSDEIFWINPTERGIIPLDGLHVSRSLARDFIKREFGVRTDTCFSDVVAGCADRPETWINAEIYDLYGELHKLGYAHSVEIFQDGQLVGGVYGVSIAGAFFGESMFSRIPSASKYALVALVARLRAGGYRLLDTQFVTPHLITMGAIEISREDYHRKLANALQTPAEFDRLPADTPRQVLLQLTTQTS